MVQSGFEISPCFDSSLCRLFGVAVFKVISNVIDPAIDVDLGKFGCKRLESRGQVCLG